MQAVGHRHRITPHIGRHGQPQPLRQQAHDLVAAGVAHQSPRLDCLVVMLCALQVDDGQLSARLLLPALVHARGLERQVAGGGDLQTRAQANGQVRLARVLLCRGGATVGKSGGMQVRSGVATTRHWRSSGASSSCAPHTRQRQLIRRERILPVQDVVP